MREAFYDDGKRRIVPDWVKPHHNVVWRITDNDSGDLLAMGADKVNAVAGCSAKSHAESTEGWHGKPVKVTVGVIYY